MADCEIVDVGYAKQRDLALELPPTPLAAVMSNEQWEQVYDRLAELVAAHRTTLVFVNTRRMAERAARHLAEIARQGRGRGAPRQPRQGDTPRRRAAPEARRAEGAGRDGVARAGHRHRRRRSRLPARLAAIDRSLPAARGTLGPCCRRHAQGAAVSAVARRARRMRGAARLRAPRRTRCAARVAGTARRAGAADRRRDCMPRMGRGRAVRAGAPRLAVRAADARGLCRGRAHAGRRLHDPAGPARAMCIAMPFITACASAGRAPDRADLGRHDPRDRRLHGGARAAGAQDRHGQRGLRGRKPGGRHLPARQRELPDPADRTRPRARRGRARRAAEHPVLARRGAGPQRRAVLRRRAAARARSPTCIAARRHRCNAAIGSSQTSRHRQRGRAPDRRLPGARAGVRSARCRRRSAS